MLPAIVSGRELRPDRGSCVRFSLPDEPTLLVKAGQLGKGIFLMNGGNLKGFRSNITSHRAKMLSHAK